MGQSIISTDTASSNGTSTLYQMPAGSTGFLGNITAYNTTAGAISVRLNKVNSAGTNRILVVKSIGATSSYSFSGGSVDRITPVTLIEGEKVTVYSTAVGVDINGSGLRIFT